jgi:hypothetical protein
MMVILFPYKFFVFFSCFIFYSPALINKKVYVYLVFYSSIFSFFPCTDTAFVDISLSDETVSFLTGISKRLRCVVRGIPSPVITWYKPDGQEIISNITTFSSFSEMLLHIEEPRAFGKYKCRATNSLGYSEHTIDVVKSGSV